MKRILKSLLMVSLCSQVWASDTIVTKKNLKHIGTVVERNATGYVLRTPDGSLVVVPLQDIAKIIRNNQVFDFEKKMGYYLEKRRPFLPFIVLGVAAGAWSVKKYQDYSLEKDRVAEREAQGLDDLTDKSTTHLAWCIASGLLSAGSFYISFKPMEVMIPIGPINIGLAPNRIGLAYQF